MPPNRRMTPEALQVYEERMSLEDRLTTQVGAFLPKPHFAELQIVMKPPSSVKAGDDFVVRVRWRFGVKRIGHLEAWDGFIIVPENLGGQVLSCPFVSALRVSTADQDELHELTFTMPDISSSTGSVSVGFFVRGSCFFTIAVPGEHPRHVLTGVYCSDVASISWAGARPDIRLFDITEQVRPGQSPTIRWSVARVLRLDMQRISPVGPKFYLEISNAERGLAEGSQELSSFSEKYPVEGVYLLQAENEFGYFNARCTVRLREVPRLTVRGMEVVQAIQRFTVAITPQPSNNSVRLVQDRQTVVRVYVDSGISSGFRNNVQPNVTGILRVSSPNGVVDIGPANSGLLPWGAKALAAIDRRETNASLNFKLDSWLCSGTCYLEATAYVNSDDDGNSHEGEFDQGWAASGATNVSFAKRGYLWLRPFLITTSAGTPTQEQYLEAVDRILTRYPLSTREGILLRPSTPLTATEDLTTDEGWDDLLFRLSLMTWGTDDISAGLVLWQSTYEHGGVGSAFLEALVGVGWSFPHELGHVLGLHHSNCGSPTPPIDYTLSPKTEEAGFDTFDMIAIPPGRGDLMSYCDIGMEWPAIVTWNRLYDALEP